MPARRRHAIPPVARHSLGLAFAVPEVMTHRLLRLWLAGPKPSARDRREFARMGAEKLPAFYASWHAMVLALYRANLRLACAPMWWLSLYASPGQAPRRLAARGQRTALDVLGQGLAPLHRRAAATRRACAASGCSVAPTMP